MSHWIFKNESYDPEYDKISHAGFVYIITNNITGKKYIGKKIFTFAKTKQVKKKKKKFRIASDWKSYFGSNKELKHDVENLGKENFTREILHLCKTKGTANYFEIYEIMVRQAILSEEYYNQWISVKVSKSQIKF